MKNSMWGVSGRGWQGQGRLKNWEESSQPKHCGSLSHGSTVGEAAFRNVPYSPFTEDLCGPMQAPHIP